MGRPSRSTFLKREKERARFEKRQSKLARRQGKTASDPDPEGGSGAPGEEPSEQEEPRTGEPD
ncbi:MAG TPA: hypothetical protein VFV75_01360 [Candidatus Polarisedimenticolaceae bacterium]|nr:hypothetical protein [Candidatus Polarisedimenticolaceae bacterium]